MAKQLTFYKSEDFEGFSCASCHWNFPLPAYGSPEREHCLEGVQKLFDAHKCRDYERRVEDRKPGHREMPLTLPNGTTMVVWLLDESEHGRHIIHHDHQLPAQLLVDGTEAHVAWSRLFGVSVESGLTLRKP